MHLINIRLCVYVEPKRISSESKHSPSDKEKSHNSFLKEYLRNIKNINKKLYVKQVSSSITCKYNLLRKADTFA